MRTYATTRVSTARWKEIQGQLESRLGGGSLSLGGGHLGPERLVRARQGDWGGIMGRLCFVF